MRAGRPGGGAWGAAFGEAGWHTQHPHRYAFNLLYLPCQLRSTAQSFTRRDEPTSGLDSAAAYYVMAAVRRLAEHCRTVVRQARAACAPA